MIAPTKAQRCLLATCLVLSLCGCSLEYPVAGVYSPGSDCATYVLSNSKFPNVLLNVDEENKTLQYATAYAETNHLGLFRSFTFTGALVDKRVLSWFSRDRWQHGMAKWCGAVSPDCGSVVYLEHDYPTDTTPCDLVCEKFGSKERRVLVKNLAKTPHELEWLAWVDTNRVTVAKHPLGREGQARLMIIDVARCETILDLTSYRVKDCSVSHTRQYMAYWEASEMFSDRGCIRIIDLVSLRRVASTESGQLARDGGLKWNSEDDKLAYVMDNQLRTFSLATQTSQTLYTFGQSDEDHMDVALQGYSHARLYYRTEDPKDHALRLQWLDEVTRTPNRFQDYPKGPFNAYICLDGTVIFYILGQQPLGPSVSLRGTKREPDTYGMPANPR